MFLKGVLYAKLKNLKNLSIKPVKPACQVFAQKPRFLRILLFSE